MLDTRCFGRFPHVQSIKAVLCCGMPCSVVPCCVLGCVCHHNHPQAWSTNSRVLNLFGYTGGFSVYAGLAGASSVTTVDVADAALSAADANWALNGLKAAKHQAVTADAFDFLERAQSGECCVLCYLIVGLNTILCEAVCCRQVQLRLVHDLQLCLLLLVHPVAL